MIVPDHQLADILAGRCTEALVPHRKRLGDRQPIRRPQRPDEQHPPQNVCIVRVKATATVELDTLTDAQAQTHGYETVTEWRDDWCRIHQRAWTGERALLVTFEVAKESARVFRGPWDPGSAGDIGPERRRAPEPEQVDARPFAEEAQRRWERDQQHLEAIYRALPLDQKLKLVQQDERLRIAGRDDLRVIEKRLDAIWRRGKAA